MLLADIFINESVSLIFLDGRTSPHFLFFYINPLLEMNGRWSHYMVKFLTFIFYLPVYVIRIALALIATALLLVPFIIQMILRIKPDKGTPADYIDVTWKWVTK